MLKTFQRLGYFVQPDDVPPATTTHVAAAAGLGHAVGEPEHRGPLASEVALAFGREPGVSPGLARLRRHDIIKKPVCGFLAPLAAREAGIGRRGTFRRDGDRCVSVIAC